MIELLRKSFMAGLGAVVVTRDKIMEITKSLVEEGKISTDEAEKLTEDLVKSGERQWDEINARFQSSFRRFSENVDMARKKELEDLKARVEILEQRLSIHEQTHVRQAAQTEVGDTY